MNKYVILLILLIIASYIDHNLWAQTYRGQNTGNFSFYLIEFQINADSTVNFMYDGSGYAEYSGKITKISDTAYRVSVKEDFSQSWMMSLPQTKYFSFKKDTIITNHLNDISIVYSNGYTLKLGSYIENSDNHFLYIPIDYSLFNENYNHDYYYVQFQRKNKITNKPLVFKVEYGSDIVFSCGENIEFDIIITDCRVFSINEGLPQIGDFELYLLNNKIRITKLYNNQAPHE